MDWIVSDLTSLSQYFGWEADQGIKGVTVKNVLADFVR